MELKPGLYHDIPFDTYAGWPAINHSILRHFKKTPAHAHWAMTHDEHTDAKELGFLVHLAALEPDLYRKDVVVAPKVDKRTKIGKAEWAAFEREAGDKHIAKADDAQVAKAILENVGRHAFARELLRSQGAKEVSIVWRDAETGILCKGRLDRITMISDQGVIVDVKTIGKPATTHNFQTSIQMYDYAGQAAFYLQGLATLLADQPIPKFIWVVCETKAPYLVRVFEAEDEALAIGADEMGKALSQFKECQETGFWPGWGDGMDTAGLPPWVYKRYNVE